MKKAFTLIELLVVIAIIAILAAILFPVFAQAKVAAKKTAALASVKQTGLGAIMYASDNDDTMPYQDWYAEGSGASAPGMGSNRPLGFLDPTLVGANWGMEIFPYVKSTALFQTSVPKYTGTGWPYWAYSNNPNAGNSSFSYNGAVSQAPSTTVSAPADLIVFTGLPATVSMAYLQPARPWTTATVCNSIDGPLLGYGFMKGNVYAFMDGHSKFLNRPQVTYRNYGISGNLTGGTNGAGVDMTGKPNTTGLTDLDRRLAGDTGWQATGPCDISAL